MGLLDILVGPVVGTLGAIAGKVFELKLESEKRETLKLKQAHELAIRDKDREMAAQEAAAQFKIHEVDADAAVAQAELGTIAQSYAADKATYGEGKWGQIVDAARGLTRPTLTVWAAIVLGYVTWQSVAALHGKPIDLNRAWGMLDGVVVIAGTVITWWFGARYSRAKGK